MSMLNRSVPSAARLGRARSSHAEAISGGWPLSGIARGYGSARPETRRARLPALAPFFPGRGDVSYVVWRQAPGTDATRHGDLCDAESGVKSM
jgi:hypothetical protein